MEFSAENLEKAVTLFYRTEAGQQAEAHQWLTEAQNSPQAWSFVWELLDPQRSSEVQFFAATTLHTKLLKYWNEVPEDHYELLKKRILETIVSYAMGPKIVLNRLCITLSAYIIHTVPLHWPKAFEELVSSFQPHHLPNVEPERVIWILLEILTVIPEEFQSTTLATTQRNRVRAVLQEVSKDILKVVEMCLTPLPGGGFSNANLTTYLNSTRCASAWIQLGGVNIEDCSQIMEILVDLLCYIYWNRLEVDGMTSEELELGEVAVEALSGVMLHPHTHKYKSYVIKHAANFLHKFSKILEQERHSCDPNKDIVASIYGLLVTTADTHAKLFIENLKSDVQQEQRISAEVFGSILECTNLPGLYPVDESSSTLTFGFWYTLQDDILSLDAAECAELLLMIKPFYRNLACVMLRKSMYPNIWDDCSGSVWSLDDREVFRCYRQDIADTFMYCYNVLNLEMLDILNTKLNEALQKCRNEDGTTARENWTAIESCLHAFAAVAECIECENLYLPKLMHVLRSIPYDDLHTKVLASALDTVGAYSEWITDHPDVLPSVMPLVISGLNNPEVAPSATMALKDLSHNCQKYLQPYAEHILIACQSGLQNSLLKLSERTRIMYSLGKVLSILPVPKVMDYLNVVLAPSFEEMSSLVNAQHSVTVTTSLITKLRLLSALFCTLHVKATAPESVQQPILLIVQNTLPLYIQIGNKYCDNSEVMEVLCGLLKHTVTTLLNDCRPIVPDILQLIVSVYTKVPQGSLLILAKTILIMFGKEEEYANMMQQFLYEIVNKTLQLCAQLNGTERLSEKSDVLESFFILLAQMSKKCECLIFNSGMDCAALFQCAVLCLSLPEVQTLKACASFLVSFISQSRESGQADVVQECGEALVIRILISLAASAPRSSADVFADILLVLNKKYCDNLSRWLHAQLAQEGFPSVRVNHQQKQHFIRIVLREKANKRKLSETVTEFTLLCRGILKPDTST